MSERFGHPGRRRFGEYLAGVLDESNEARFERHVGECSACAQRLQQEALFEVSLFEAAEPQIVQRLPRTEWAARWACAVMAAAAAVLLVLADPSQYLQLDSFPSMTASIDGAMAALDLDGVCMPPVEGEADTCEEPLTVALATMPAPEPSAFELMIPGNECWLDDHAIDPLCVTSDPLAG